MNSWTVLLQLEGVSNAVINSCTRYAMSGVALPVQISIVACDAVAEASAQAAYRVIENRLSMMHSRPDDCGGPGGLGCMAWGESSCRHILVLVIGSVPLDQKYECLANDWLRRGGSKAVVIPVLAGGITHAQVFANNLFPTLSQCNLAAWGGSISRLAEIILSAALIDEKPGVFISYLRDEASAGAEHIHDALIREGFRVFLDRFSGTAGRLFPHELAEAMADMGLVVLLETPNLRSSRWTLWEAAFAHRYRIGPIAVNFNGSTGLRSVSARHYLANAPVGLSQTDVDGIVRFVQDEYLKIAVGRRAYYETLIRLASQSKGGYVKAIGAGVLEIEDFGNTTRGFALPSGVPGQLKHVRRLVEATTGGSSLLAGEHQHLSPSNHSDLEWLAAKDNVKLTGSASIYRIVRSIV